MKLVECVPNISEGRDPELINRLAQSIESVPGVTLLHQDSGLDANRSVFTFAGAPEETLEAAFSLTKLSAELLDMRSQTGAHPRLGAADVIPFVPLAGVSLEECVQLARRLGERVGSELGIPVYLYEAAASAEHRRVLADVRRGEYEGLAKKLHDTKWKPDYGPTQVNEKSGASIVGARNILIAYNVNLNTRDVEVAKEIAKRIRTRGEVSPTRLHACRAIGWDMPKFNCAQVSTNLYDFRSTSMFDAFEACAREAATLGARVTGSELIGLVPLEALCFVGEQAGAAGSTMELVSTAIQALGLSEFNQFKPEERVIEFILEARAEIRK